MSRVFVLIHTYSSAFDILQNAIRGILQIIEKIENDELEAQVFRRNNTGTRLPLAGTTPTPRTSLIKKKE